MVSTLVASLPQRDFLGSWCCEGDFATGIGRYQRGHQVSVWRCASGYVVHLGYRTLADLSVPIRPARLGSYHRATTRV